MKKVLVVGYLDLDKYKKLAETGDTRPVDEVMYYTRQLNPNINAGLVQPGTRIIVPCQTDRKGR